MKYYIVDPSTGNKTFSFNSLNEVISYLEIACKRLHKMSRKDYMQNLEELGYSADDALGRNFIEAMADSFNIGVIKDNKLVRCNIFEATHYSKYKNEMGD